MRIINVGDAAALGVHGDGVRTKSSVVPLQPARDDQSVCGLCPQRLTGLCGRIRPEDTQELAVAMDRIVTVHQRAVVAEQGSEATILFRVVGGWVLLSHDGVSGDRTVLDVVVPGETFSLPGEADGRLYYTATALTDVAVCLIPHKRLEALRLHQPGLDGGLLGNAASRIARWQHQAVSIAHGTARARVAAFLLDAYLRGVEGGDEPKPSSMPLRQLDIADATGITAPYANKVLKRLASEEILTLRRGYVRVENQYALRIIAGTALD